MATGRVPAEGNSSISCYAHAAWDRGTRRIYEKGQDLPQPPRSYESHVEVEDEDGVPDLRRGDPRLQREPTLLIDARFSNATFSRQCGTTYGSPSQRLSTPTPRSCPRNEAPVISTAIGRTTTKSRSRWAKSPASCGRIEDHQDSTSSTTCVTCGSSTCSASFRGKRRTWHCTLEPGNVLCHSPPRGWAPTLTIPKQDGQLLREQLYGPRFKIAALSEAPRTRRNSPMAGVRQGSLRCRPGPDRTARSNT